MSSIGASWRKILTWALQVLSVSPDLKMLSSWASDISTGSDVFMLLVAARIYLFILSPRSVRNGIKNDRFWCVFPGSVSLKWSRIKNMSKMYCRFKKGQALFGAPDVRHHQPPRLIPDAKAYRPADYKSIPASLSLSRSCLCCSVCPGSTNLAEGSLRARSCSDKSRSSIDRSLSAWRFSASL